MLRARCTSDCRVDCYKTVRTAVLRFAHSGTFWHVAGGPWTLCTTVPCCSQGVWEKDAERKDDSFDTFEEVLQMAVEHDVDFLLLGGDLFHDNKPSRSTVRSTAESSSPHSQCPECVDAQAEHSFPCRQA